ncbi:phenylalanine--tRNA ligase subunit beta [Candidatus Peregrinibacteria bacterium]|nr:phenylalanine--tRNA ligase subunit beta [Candidatus Peregrinibacteria bacterium]
MLVSLNWLKDFVELPKNVDGKSLAHDLTLKTAEVDNVIDEGKIYEKMVVGHVLELHKHPHADKFKIAKVSIGKETVQIVCGGENLKEGMYVAVSLPGAKVKWHGEGEYVTLEETKIRGEKSYGMICAGNEIGIEDMRAHGEATGRARRERVPRDRSLQINRAQRDEQSGSASCETKRAYQTTSARDIMDLSSIKQAPGTPLQSLFGKNDIIFEFDNKSLTHRPDLWGHYGIAREIAAITKSKFKPISPKVKIPSTGEKIGLKIEAEDLCPRYCGLIINNIKVEESPDWLKTRLKATGHGTHNNIVDVTNYILAELGQPMHAFDKSYIKKGIVVRRAKKGEKITSLDNKERILSEEMLVIADHEKPVAIAGVMGGENSEINKNTTSIILESANFSASSVRRASTKLGLRTESVQRFEKALDPNLAELAIKRAAELILKICPKAVIAGPITDKGKFNKKPLKINLNYKTIISKIGVEISKKEIMEILKSLEFKVLQKAQGFTVEIPSFRATKDVLFEDDLIEEIARMFGYEKIPPSLPTLPTKLPMENTERFKKHRAREFMSYGLGFDEIYNYSFYGKKDFEKCLMTEKSHLKLLNSLSEEQTHLATSLIPNLLKNLESNTKYFDEIRLYEIGRTYKDTGTLILKI